MMRNKTTLIVGAGASAEVNMPVGAKLKNEIASKFDFEFEPFSAMPKRGDETLFRALAKFSPDFPKDVDEVNKHLHAGRHIRAAIAQAPSIDEFIDNQRNNRRIASCGKIAIVRCILEAERKSLLFFDDSKRNNIFDLYKLEDAWYSPFFRVIIEGADIDSISDRLSDITIISFNYDRCISHFLHTALKNYFSCSDEKAAEILLNLNIIYPYGTIGTLPWQGYDDCVKFGGSVPGEKLFELSGNLSTFTEQIENQQLTNNITNALQEASMVVFLGFAYHPQNMRIISAPDGTEKKIFGTAHGFSNFDRNHIRGELSDMYSIPVQEAELSNTTCRKLFDEYSRALKMINFLNEEA